MAILTSELIADSNLSTYQSMAQSRKLLERAIIWDTNHPGAHRGLGLVYWRQGDDDRAFDEWRQAGLTADNFIAFGMQRHQPEQSLRWYELAERLQPANPGLWLQVGKICQVHPKAGDICPRFLAYNDQNWFVDPDFAFEQTAWHFNRREGVNYKIVECPELSGQSCATVIIDDVTPQHGASWQQCLHLEPGVAYVYSAWIKVDIVGEGHWRPLYFQGAVNGQQSGHWPGNQFESVGWRYEERSFVAPEFDGNRACFHPVRLEGRGQFWFYNASLQRQ
ncbi:MAG: hypothetical protein GY832_32485 [Chloroflexi bacterium]|nr:hypothetical protein [Chloroflexota bacterium]